MHGHVSVGRRKKPWALFGETRLHLLCHAIAHFVPATSLPDQTHTPSYLYSFTHGRLPFPVTVGFFPFVTSPPLPSSAC